MPRYEVVNINDYVDCVTADNEGRAAEYLAQMMHGSDATLKPLPGNALSARAWFDVVLPSGAIVDSLAVREVRR